MSPSTQKHMHPDGHRGGRSHSGGIPAGRRGQRQAPSPLQGGKASKGIAEHWEGVRGVTNHYLWPATPPSTTPGNTGRPAEPGPDVPPEQQGTPSPTDLLSPCRPRAISPASPTDLRPFQSCEGTGKRALTCIPSTHSRCTAGHD
ncbi:hypothetical protein D3C77_496640 [compost metagenome]